jgi:very-short-patch-repair endonuclease
MAHDLVALLGPAGAVRAEELLRRVDRHTVARWVRRGRLLRPHPGVLVLPERADDWSTRALAGVLATGGTLSHWSALALWRRGPTTGPVHVSVSSGRRALRSPGLVVHRVQLLDADRIGGLPVTGLPRAVVDSWGLARRAGSPLRDIETARAAVITTIRERQVKPAELLAAVSVRPALPRRADLLDLVTKVAGGSHSELEIWGVDHVLDGPGMPRFVRQLRIALPHGNVRLDAAVPHLRVAIELDGAAFHGDPAARERDTRRDVALAALGWVVLRFSYRRLTREPDACRREILEVCAARRSLLGRR